jgi:hypothetical protein
VFTEAPHLAVTVGTLTLIQTGASVTGVLALHGRSGGSVTGTVTGHRFDLELTTLQPCQGSGIPQTLNISADFRNLSGTLTGSDCLGSLLASFYAANLSTVGGTETSPDVTGSWDLTLISGTGEATGLAGLVQNGAAVTGTIVLPSGEATVQGIVGDLLGTQSSIVYLTVYGGVVRCPSSVAGLLTVSADGSTASGSWGGYDCNGASFASISAVRRPATPQP